MNCPCEAAGGDVWDLFKTDGCKPVVTVLEQYFPHNNRVENQAGEKRMGCDCSPPQITAAGNAGRTRIFRIEGFGKIRCRFWGKCVRSGAVNAEMLTDTTKKAAPR